MSTSKATKPNGIGFSSRINLFANSVKIGDEPEVIDVGRDLFQSEELVDTAYRAYLDLMVEAWTGFKGDDVDIRDLAAPYTGGLYICGVERSIITQQYDSRNDVVPAEFSVWFDGAVDVMREIPRLPRSWRSAAKGRHFRHTVICKNEKTETARVTSTICTLCDDGRIYAAVPTVVGENPDGIAVALQRIFASISVGLFCDRRHLWQVETHEPTISDAKTTRLSVGVSDEHIKSLFYARSLPVTESGRKRPILHWVRAHQRRLAEGIEIDVSRHLKGASEFEMGGFDWQIVNPQKTSGKSHG